MSEHTYRLIIGSLLLALLYTESTNLAYFIIAMTLVEGLTNQRLNLVVTRIRHKLFTGTSQSDLPPRQGSRIPIDAERAQRLFISLMFAALYFGAPEELWMLNWFFAFGMLLSGIVMFCPVIALFRVIGFR